MKLIDLIKFFRQGNTFEEFCKEQGLKADSEVIEIYAQEPVCLEAQLGFFPIEETRGRIQFESKGAKYHNLFDFFYFLDAIEEIKDNMKTTDSDLANKLYNYAIKDA